MLKALNRDQVHFIALLARAARTQRDAVLGNVAEADLGGATPGRGEHNPTTELALDPLRGDAAQLAALSEAIASLSATARFELYALMQLGQGQLTARKWHSGLAEAEMLGEAAITAAIMDDPDLHDHLTKGLFEAKLS